MSAINSIWTSWDKEKEMNEGQTHKPGSMQPVDEMEAARKRAEYEQRLYLIEQQQNVAMQNAAGLQSSLAQMNAAAQAASGFSIPQGLFSSAQQPRIVPRFPRINDLQFGVPYWGGEPLPEDWKGAKMEPHSIEYESGTGIWSIELRSKHSNDCLQLAYDADELSRKQAMEMAQQVCNMLDIRRAG